MTDNKDPQVKNSLPLNFTPHDVKFVKEDGSTVTLPKSGAVARVDMDEPTYRTLPNGFKVCDPPKYKSVTGLPSNLRLVVVSEITARAIINLPGYEEWIPFILTPSQWPSDCVRDEKGNICGTRAFIKYDSANEDGESERARKLAKFENLLNSRQE